ncbi:MAG TPA: C25 family cysteine peptidase [bacterium]
MIKAGVIKYVMLGVVITGMLWAGEIVQTVSFSPGDLYFTAADNYDVVDLKGYPSGTKLGEPRLPRVVQALVIPAGANPVSVELISEEAADIPGTYNILPTQHDVPLPMPGKVFTPKVSKPNSLIYGSENSYPEINIRLTGAGTLNGYRIAHVEIYPLTYQPKKQKLTLVTKLTYRLTYKEHQVDAWIPTLLQQQVSGQEVRSIVANPGAVDKFAPEVRLGMGSRALPPGNYQYVVISAPPVDTVLQRLANWKTKKGIPATVVLVSYINSNYTGYDLAEKVRNFIIDAYATWGSMYFLLGGSGDYNSTGQNLVPTRKGWYTSAGGPDGDYLPADLYYSDLNGNWDADGDHTYGELSDNVNMYHDVYVGRASVYTVALAQNFVYKVFKYEKNPPTGYLRKMLLPTAILWSSYEERPMQDSIARMTPAATWTDGKLYERNGTLSPQLMVDSMNVGFGMGAWEGHGDENGIYMGSTPYLSSSAADGLINGDKVGINISIACMTGGWDLVSSGLDCFAEHLVNRQGGGLVASMMNARYGWGAYTTQYVPGPSERLDTTFYAKIFNAGMYNIGPILAVDKDAWVPYADSGNQYDMTRWCIYELNLFGDPEMPLWTDIPATMQVTYNAMVPMGTNSFTVTVKESDGTTPVTSALVCLDGKSDAGLYGTGNTNGSGVANITITAMVPLDTMWVTVTKKNHYPYEGYAIVIDAGMPAMPTVVKPMDFARLSALNPVLTFYSTDPQGEQIRYCVKWDTDPTFASPESSLTANYASGAVVNFSFPSDLTNGTTYWWKVKCSDPSGSGYWTSYTTARSFTVDTSLPANTCSWFQTTAAQFSYNTYNATMIQGDSVILVPSGAVVVDTIQEQFFDVAGIPSGWSVVNGNGDSYMWTVGTTSDLGSYTPPSYGTYYAYYSDDDAGSGVINNNEELLSPKWYVGGITDDLEVEYGYGFQIYQVGEKYRLKFRKKTGSGAWTAWTDLVVYSSSGAGTQTVSLTSQLPCDSMQFDWFFSDSTASSHWGYANAADNVVLKRTYTLSNDYGTMTGMGIDYKELSKTFNRNKWGWMVFHKATAGDSIGLQVEYYTGSAWQLVPNGTLPGNSTGFFKNAAYDSVNLSGLDTNTYRNIRLKGTFYRKSSKAPTNPALLDWEVGNLNGLVGVAEQNGSMLVTSLALSPNPFFGKTVIKYVVSSKEQNGNPSLRIFDASGRLVKSFELPTTYSVLPTDVIWDGSDDIGRRVPAGVYFVRFEVNGEKKTEKAILLR